MSILIPKKAIKNLKKICFVAFRTNNCQYLVCEKCERKNAWDLKKILMKPPWRTGQKNASCKKKKQTKKKNDLGEEKC